VSGGVQGAGLVADRAGAGDELGGGGGECAEQLIGDVGSALKVPLDGLAESKEKVHSAMNRATRKQGRKVATATDANFLDVWNVTESVAPSTAGYAGFISLPLICRSKPFGSLM
jgi:hypothetical protein